MAYLATREALKITSPKISIVMRLLNNSDICILAKGRFPGFSPPDVPLGIEVILGEVLHDSVHQLAHAAEAAGQNHLLAQVSEEAFDQDSSRMNRWA